MSDTSVRFPGVLSFFLRVFDLRSRPSGSPRADILFGLTDALALVPEAVAFAFLAGVPPLVGLYAAFVLCLIMVVVSVYTVLMHDLAPAVILGVALSALVFSWNKSKHLLVDAQFNEYGGKDLPTAWSVVFRFCGPVQNLVFSARRSRCRGDRLLFLSRLRPVGT